MLVNRKSKNLEIKIGKIVVGSKKVVLVAGPCAVESKEQLFAIAKAVKKAGASVIRGGAFKPRTSPYSFQGLGKKGLEYLDELRRTLGVPVITELMDTTDADLVARNTDIIQIGARNMQNFELLKEVGKLRNPVLLKRGFSATINEWLSSAEYILKGGNRNVILCERGIRTFERAVRNTLDLSCIPILKQKTSLPVFVDPSHATGNPSLIPSMSKAAIAAGADGLMIEVHNNPAKALCDGPQSLLPQQFAKLVKELRLVTKAVNRVL